MTEAAAMPNQQLRAICNVCTQGNIQKVGKVPGRYGRKVFSYMLVPTEMLVRA